LPAHPESPTLTPGGRPSCRYPPDRMGKLLGKLGSQQLQTHATQWKL
jgi:hypothetical protein